MQLCELEMGAADERRIDERQRLPRRQQQHLVLPVAVHRRRTPRRGGFQARDNNNKNMETQCNAINTMHMAYGLIG